MSSISINSVNLAGYLTRDPEMRDLGLDGCVCCMRIAINERDGSKDRRRSGTTNFFDVIAYGAQGETAAKWLRKGEPIYIAGRLEFREWVTSTGRRAEKVRVVANQVEFLARVGRSRVDDEMSVGGEVGPGEDEIEPASDGESREHELAVDEIDEQREMPNESNATDWHGEESVGGPAGRR